MPSNFSSAYFAGNKLLRASWLRGSNAFLNAALTSDAARIILLDHGNPLVHKSNERRKQLFLAKWADIRSAVLACVNEPAHGVFGCESYGLQMSDKSTNTKKWLTGTSGIVSPLLSLAFLGVDETQPHFTMSANPNTHIPAGTPYFALSLSHRPPNIESPTPCEVLRDTLLKRYDVLDMRFAVAFGSLTQDEASILGPARSLLDWNERYKFCPACGSELYSAWSGHKRICSSLLSTLAKPSMFVRLSSQVPAHECISWTSMQNYTYPRTDPVVLVGVVNATNDKILLGRKKGWPNGFYSCIAYVHTTYHSGFVEQGETIEDAARREAMEETGLDIGHVTYQWCVTK